MNYLGIDYGEKRIGLSCGDSDVRLAVPVAAAVEPTFTGRMEHIAEEIRTRRIGELVVGYPYNMDGSVGFKAKEVDAFIEKLAAQFALPIHRTDERLTSSDAQSRMNEAARGNRSRGKQSIRAKLAERKSGVLDSRAATLILQDHLDSLPGSDVALFDTEEDPFAQDDFAQSAGHTDPTFTKDGNFTKDNDLSSANGFAEDSIPTENNGFVEDNGFAEPMDYDGEGSTRGGGSGSDYDDEGDDDRGRRNGSNHRRKGGRRR